MRVRLAMIPMAAVVVWGCSVTARDRLAHFFFEIPEPIAEGDVAAKTASSEDRPPALQLPPPRFVSVHEPFRERTCTACHDAGNRMQPHDDIAAACKTCHAEYFSERVGHFPVSAGQCTQCHDPHRSTRRALLMQDVHDTCVECHEEPEDLSEEAHGGDDVDNCVRCHDAHFGESPLLKPGVKGASEQGEEE